MIELFGGDRRGRGRRALGARAGLAVALVTSLGGCAAGSEAGTAGAGAAEIGSTEVGATTTGAPEIGTDVTSAAETREVPADAARGAPVEGDVKLPGLDPAWDEQGTGGGAVPASLGARPGSAGSADLESIRPMEGRMRSAPHWKGERLEGRVQPKPTPASRVKP